MKRLLMNQKIAGVALVVSALATTQCTQNREDQASKSANDAAQRTAQIGRDTAQTTDQAATDAKNSATDLSKKTGETASEAMRTTGDAVGESSGALTKHETPIALDRMSKQHVKRLQQALKDHGMKLHADGIPGPATESAIRQFQQNEKIAGDGTLTGATLEKLGLSAAEMMPAE